MNWFLCWFLLFAYQWLSVFCCGEAGLDFFSFSNVHSFPVVSYSGVSSCLSFFFFFNCLNVYLFLRERQSASRGGAERGWHWIWSRLRALSGQPRAWCGARTQKPQDHDRSRSRTLNWWSHPGAPMFMHILMRFLVAQIDCFEAIPSISFLPVRESPSVTISTWKQK